MVGEFRLRETVISARHIEEREHQPTHPAPRRPSLCVSSAHRPPPLQPCSGASFPPQQWCPESQRTTANGSTNKRCLADCWL